MKSKERKEFLARRAKLRKALQVRTWSNYRKLLGRLFAAHSSFPYTSDLRQALGHGDIGRLVELADSLAAQQYSSSYEHFVANQFALLIRKYPGFPKGHFDPEAEARTKFLAAEARCSERNARGPSPEWESHYHEMRKFLAYVIGHSPNLREVWKGCDFGPGASIGVSGNATNVGQKIAKSWSVSPSAYAYAKAAVQFNWHLVEILLDEGRAAVAVDPDLMKQRFESKVALVHNNKVSFVPKTVKTHRSIAVEPVLNGFVQKGVDQVLRSRLKRIGIDLRRQEPNCEMARIGSLADQEDPWVTIDLSAASDSMSISLVKELLPPEWFEFLNNLRSRSYEWEGDVILPYHKFCSMGNGFCFPLETLLFTAACNACGCGRPGVDFRVYGDDIIVRQSKAVAVIELLADMGFQVNKEKTFIDGPFRESCGRDWHRGVDVRPFVLDFQLDSLESCFKFLNLTLRNELCKEFFAPVRDFVMSLVPVDMRLVRPHKGPADTAICVELDAFMASPYARWSRDLQTWTWTEMHFQAAVDPCRSIRTAKAVMYALLRGAQPFREFTLRRVTKTGVRTQVTQASPLVDWCDPDGANRVHVWN